MGSDRSLVGFYRSISSAKHSPIYWPRALAFRLLAGLILALKALSHLAVPLVLTFFPLYAFGQGVSIYSEFIEGAKEGFQTALRIIPYLVAMLVAIAVFRESGALDFLKLLLGPVLALLQIPNEMLPMVLMRPLSGSGSLAVLSDMIKQFGPDSLLTYTAATIYGSAETTFLRHRPFISVQSGSLASGTRSSPG